MADKFTKNETVIDTIWLNGVDHALYSNGVPIVKVSSDTTEAGTNQIINMVSLTQAAYDALTPVATTFYVIVS